MTRPIVCWCALLGLATGGAARAQPPKRLPIIAGNGLVQVLVDVDGTVKTWGNPHAMDPSPSLGDGVKPSAAPDVRSPRPLAGVRDVVGAAVAVTHVLLLKGDGTVLAWGENDSCELGTGDDKTRLSPVAVPGLRGVVEVAASTGVSGAVLSDGSVWSWGGRDDCAIGPTKVEGLTGVKRLSLDGSSALALKDDGTVWGWGKNGSGGLCDGTKEPRLHPVQAKDISNAVDLAIGGNSIVVLADGTVRACGSNVDAALGDFSGAREHLTPFHVPGVSGVRSVRSDGATTIVQLRDLTLRGWGNGYYGSLGDGHGDRPTTRPVAPIGVGPVLAHYTSGSGSYAIRADGTVMVWGIPAAPGGKTEFVLTPIPGFKVALDEVAR